MPSRYHFTDESPFVVKTAEGDVSLGNGWLAITETEYQHLLEIQRMASIPKICESIDMLMNRTSQELNPSSSEQVLIEAIAQDSRHTALLAPIKTSD